MLFLEIKRNGGMARHQTTPTHAKSTQQVRNQMSHDPLFSEGGTYTNNHLPAKTQNHEAGSLPSLVENLVKNWEIEASFKPTLSDWRTISPHTYTFAINGGPPQTAEHMLNVGTYNAIISSKNEYYDPANSDFATSHKTFKRMMPTFAWEVLEVYSGPPTVAFRWRHWGEMKGDYVGFNEWVSEFLSSLLTCTLSRYSHMHSLHTSKPSSPMLLLLDTNNQAAKARKSLSPHTAGRSISRVSQSQK